jgi:hypothetical protein
MAWSDVSMRWMHACFAQPMMIHDDESPIFSPASDKEVPVIDCTSSDFTPTEAEDEDEEPCAAQTDPYQPAGAAIGTHGQAQVTNEEPCAAQTDPYQPAGAAIGAHGQAQVTNDAAGNNINSCHYDDTGPDTLVIDSIDSWLYADTEVDASSDHEPLPPPSSPTPPGRPLGAAIGAHGKAQVTMDGADVKGDDPTPSSPTPPGRPQGAAIGKHGVPQVTNDKAGVKWDEFFVSEGEDDGHQLNINHHQASPHEEQALKRTRFIDLVYTQPVSVAPSRCFFCINLCF